MATTSFTVLRRFAGFAFSLTLFSLCLTGLAKGQGIAAGDRQFCRRFGSPHRVGDHPGHGDRPGRRLVGGGLANGALYEFPVGGGPAIVVAGATPSASLGGQIHRTPALSSIQVTIFTWKQTTTTAS